MLLWSAAFLVVAIAALVYFVSGIQRQAFLASHESTLTSRAERSAQSIVDIIVALRRDVVFLAGTPPVQGIVRTQQSQGPDPTDGSTEAVWRERLQDIFAAFAATHPGYFQIRLIGVADGGLELARMDVVDGRPQVRPARELRAKADSAYFEATVRLKTGEVHLSEFALNRESGDVQLPNIRTLRAATPIYSEAGDLFGMLVINLDMGALFDSMTSSLPPGVQAYVINDRGDYLAHPEPGRSFAFERGQPATLQQDLPGLQLQPHDGAALQSVPGPTGLLHVAAKRLQFDPREPKRYLLLAYALPDGFVQTQMAGVRNTLIAVTAAIGLALLVLVYLLLRRTFAPLAQLTALAERIGKGDYDVVLPADGVGELGSFVRAFRHMLGGIDTRERLRQMTNSIQDYAIIMLDPGGRVLTWNEGAQRLTAYSESEIVGRSIETFFSAEDLAAGKPAQLLQQADSVGRSVDDGWRMRKDGTRFFANVLLTAMRDHAGVLIGFAEVTHDISLRTRAEEEIAEQRAFLRQVIDLDRNLIFAKNRKGQFTLVNQAVADAYGTSVDELIGKSDHDFNSNAQEVEHFRQDDVAVMDSLQDKFIAEEKITDASGRQRWLQTIKRPIIGADGRADAILGVSSDITERRNVEQAVREQVQRAEALLEATPDPVVIVDSAGRIAVVNARTESVFGYDRSELMGRPVELLIPPRLGAAHVEQREAYQRAPGARTMGAGRELFARRKDGSEFAVDISLSPLETPGGTLIISTVRDVTERKQAERRIRGQLEHLSLLDRITRATGERQDLKSIFQVVVRSLEDSLPTDFGCVCLYDAPSHTLSAASLDSRDGAPAQALSVTEMACIDVDANGLSRCVQGQLVYEPDVSRSEFAFPQRLARSGLRSVVMAPLKSESQVFGVLVVARRQADAFDSGECEFLRQLSEHVAMSAHQVQLYTSLQQAYDDLRQTQQAMMQEDRLRALGQMASGVAHDINNALSPVSLYTESLLETEKNLSERARGYLQTIQRAVEDVAETVSRMREFYRQREQQRAFAPVDLNQMAQQVLDLTKARWSNMALQRGISIQPVTELAPDLPRITGLESEIREALTNLVFNAVDAMPEGGALTLRTRLQGRDGPPGVVIEVIDKGLGMDEETRRRCLEPFFTTKGERGTGLGLAMVFGTVQRHAGQIEIDSLPGAGTTMRLVFTARVADDVLAPPASGAPDIPLQQLTLLLVDDDPVLLRSLQDTLQADGHAIVTANDGRQGLAVFQAALDSGKPFAAVITDLGMPHMDGRRLALAVKQASATTPVLLLTGWGQRLQAEGEIPPGVDRVLAKPAKLGELRDALSQLCRF